MGMAASDSQFHVLAVDDSLIDRKLIERLLKTSSYQVTTVDSGSKALEFLGWNECNDNSDETFASSNNNHQEVEVNLVITDYCMPGMTGYDLLKKIKESSYLRNIPVVIMSSENVPSRINRCLEEGAEEFFLKPVTPSDVNKLKPHMMKTKFKNNINDIQKPDNAEKQESSTDEDEDETTVLLLSSSPSKVQLQTNITTSQSQQQQTPLLSNIVITSNSNNNNGNNNNNNNNTNINNNSNNNNNNSSKRKSSVEEGLSPDRTRPRYNNNGLIVMSN